MTGPDIDLDVLQRRLEEAEAAMYTDVGVVRRQVAAVLDAAPRSVGGRRLRVQALTLRAILVAQAGDGLGAIRIAMPQLQAARQLGAADLEARIENVLGATYDVLDQPERAVRHYDRCIALARGVPDPALVEKAQMNTGVALSRMGEDARAIERYTGVLASMVAAGREGRAARLHQNLAISLLRLGRLDETAAALGRARGCLAVSGHARTEAHVETVEARLAGARGQPERALRHIDRAIQLADRHQLAVIELTGRCEAVALLLARRPADAPAARLHAERALALGQAIPGDEHHETALRAMAMVLEAEGRPGEALAAERQRFGLAEARWTARAAAQVATLRVEHEVATLRREGVVLASRNGQLQALADARRDGLAAASHDLRSPLMVLSVVGETLPMLDAAGVRDACERISVTVARMTDILDRVLSADAGAVGWVAGRGRPLELGGAVEGVVERYRPIASRKGQTLVLHAGGPTRVLANAGALDQVLTNLVDNAIKYSPAGGAITVRCAADAAVAWVDVLDRGPGLSDADLRGAFGRFARLSARPSAGEPSVGLGLYVVRRLVEAMGGSAEAAPRDGGGARFRITLPLA